MAEKMMSIVPPRKPIAIIRLDNLENGLEICQALLSGGVNVLEFTLTNPEAIEVIEKARKEFGERLLIGAGTVLDGQAARKCIEAGAQFLVTPALVPEVIQVGVERAIPVVCGAFTPSEILSAWRQGATLVKVFPAGQLGPSYIKDVLAPLPDIRLVPTGGVNLETCGAFLAAGAYTVAVGSQLVGKEIVAKKDWGALTKLARQYSEACAV